MGINNDVITLEDCMDMYHLKDYAVVLEDGRVKGFVEQKRES